MRLTQREAREAARIVQEDRARRTAEPAAMDGVLGSIVQRAAAAQAPTARVDRVEQWERWIVEQVRDPQLGRYRDGQVSLGGREMVRRIAAAVATDELPQAESQIHRAVRDLNWYCGRIQVLSRAAYFMGIMRRIFRQHRLAWNPTKGPGHESS